MNSTPVALRTRIVFFGRMNAGKSSLINAIAGQSVAIVSETPGTTTDPVSKTMELLPLGPCVITDTAGLDDGGELGAKRVEAALKMLDSTDIAVVAVPAESEIEEAEKDILSQCERRGIKTLLVRTKSDLAASAPSCGIPVSAATGEGVETLKAALGAMAPKEPPRPLVHDLVPPGSIVLCVCPVDAAAPKGRLILPQQQTVRDLIEHGSAALVCQPGDIPAVLGKIGANAVSLAITDSQAFGEVDRLLPMSIPLTSFSILFARFKGDLRILCAGAEAIGKLEDGDRVLVAEGCTHRRQCGDIGTEKIPRWLEKYTGKRLEFIFSSGNGFLPADADVKLIVHCGACMLSMRAFRSRMEEAAARGIPIVNYGVAIALMHGIVADPETCLVRRRNPES